MNKTDRDFLQYLPDKRQLLCRGEWNLSHIASYKKQIAELSLPSSGEIELNGQAISKLDSSGAWLLSQLVDQLSQQGVKVHFAGFSEQHQQLLSLLGKELADEKPLSSPSTLNWLAQFGKHSMQLLDEFCEYLAFVGHLTAESLRIIRQPKHFRFDSIVNTIDQTGLRALPIIGLLSFLIGVVLAYQMGVQLRNYGANIFIVDLLGLSVLREFGPLITAIMVAGRTGAAFTAQLGTMKVNQEIDALNTLGVTPAELLLLPRIGGLFIALPLLTMWADIFGILGGMFMANNMLQIGTVDFLLRFEQQVPLKTLIMGLGKAPVFALIIASIGCFQGMQVKGSADSVGKLTTRSVVLAIFFIIVADAAFSVIFSKLKL